MFLTSEYHNLAHSSITKPGTFVLVLCMSCMRITTGANCIFFFRLSFLHNLKKNNFFVSATPVLTILCDPVYVGSRQIVEEKERELWEKKEPCVFT